MVNQAYDDRQHLRGEFRMRVYRRGSLVEAYADDNLIVNGAKTVTAQMIAGDGTGRHVAKIAFGTGNSVATPNDTAISAAYTKNLSGHSYPSPGRVQFNWNLATTEANGKNIVEFGLVCLDGTLYARKVRASAIPKESDIAIEGEWIIIF